MMASNPYSGILSMMQEQGSKNNPPHILIGEVISPDPNLTIKTEDLVLDKDDILVADSLIGEYKRELSETSQGDITVTGTLNSSTQHKSGGSSYAEFASHNHDINNSATLSGTYELSGTTSITFKTGLKAGDLLAIIPTLNRQRYIVLCKVVSL